MTTLESTIELLQLFSDTTRVRLMSLLTRESLSVAELTAILELPQSRVSTHLGKLREAGLLKDRRVRTSTYYSASSSSMPAPSLELWHLVQSQARDSILDRDRERARKLKASRNGGGSWPDSIAGEMERHYSPGRTWEAVARGFLGLVRLGEVLDLGSGDGTMAELLAPRARSFTCVDRSETMIEAAKARLGEFENVSFYVGDMHELAFEQACFDEVFLFNSLTYAQRPQRALEEAARVLRPRGLLVVVTLAEHSHQEVAERYGHLQPGFRVEGLRHMLEHAAFQVESCELSSRERKKPHFEVITAFARKRACH